MSVETVRARIAELQAAFPGLGQSQRSSSVRSFDRVLTSAVSALEPSTVPGDAGQRMVRAARAEIGVTESPPGSNDSPRISQYRDAVEWSPVGPWCAYFASWAAKQAGAPLGDRGQGFARVADVWSWAKESGRAVGPTARPEPGDLVIQDGHMGVVEAVLPDGRIQTIEGNKSNKVERTVRDRSEILGFVRI